jgi:hypothetical protein
VWSRVGALGPPVGWAIRQGGEGRGGRRKRPYPTSTQPPPLRVRWIMRQGEGERDEGDANVPMGDRAEGTVIAVGAGVVWMGSGALGPPMGLGRDNAAKGEGRGRYNRGMGRGRRKRPHPTSTRPPPLRVMGRYNRGRGRGRRKRPRPASTATPAPTGYWAEGTAGAVGLSGGTS